MRWMPQRWNQTAICKTEYVSEYDECGRKIDEGTLKFINQNDWQERW